MTYDLATVLCGGKGPELPEECAWHIANNQDNQRTPCQCYQGLLEASTADVLIYVHDDVTIHEKGWMPSVIDMFEQMNATVVGLGGATSLGHPDLYKRPYRLADMARGGYVSNQADWQIHGEREQGFKKVAVVEAFFMAVRRDFLLSIGGWPVNHLSHHCLDLWLACEAARAQKDSYMVGCSVTHHGGGSSTKPIYTQAKWLQGGTLERDHQAPHEWLYDTYRDVLPIIL